jgi:putative SOS response-associated peptidase YedK
MPVIPPPERYEDLLDPQSQEGERLKALLAPLDARRMTAYPVNRLVNNPANDDLRCIEPAA